MPEYAQEDTEHRGEPSAADTAGSAGDDELAVQMGNLARSLAKEDDLDATLHAIVHASVGTVPGAQYASISAIHRRREVTTRASTSALSLAVDRAQYETGQGPCLDSLYDQRTIRLSDLGVEQRWPEFVGRAADLGVGSMLAVQLYVKDDELGALNLLSEAKDAFSDESEHIALLFATHAALALVGAKDHEELSAALGTRGIIGQAMGILMERYKITDERAFAVLTRVSQHSNRKLHVIAGELVINRELPASTAPAPAT